jgi:hypothetical protein
MPAKPPTVAEFMTTLDHPQKPAINHLRKLILALSPSITEEIKWNAPSFRTTESFATTNLRSKAGIGLILHRGAKVRDLPPNFTIDDPAGILKWLAKDRATLDFKDLKHLKANQPALEHILRQWLTFV